MRGIVTPALAALAALALAAGCADRPAITESDAGAQARAALTPAELEGLAAARAATEPFKDLGAAQAAGYDFLFMDMCMEDPSQGGMGYHWVNLGLLDAELDVARPEAVLYEPGRNGQLRLVALEYVIPAEAWTSPNPPELLGQRLTLNQFGLWALHVWVWKRNPSGVFADWNPRVSCEHAGAVAASAAAEGGHH